MKINNKKVTNISLAGKIVVQIKDVLTGQILYKEDEQKDYFSISPIDGGPAVLTITVPDSTTTYLETIEYTEDQKSWNTKTLAAGDNTIEFNDKLFLRSTIGLLGGSSATTSHKINVDVPFNAAGNIMSLLYGEDFEDKTTFEGNNYPFSFLFYQSNIVNANELSLPATTLTNSAYKGMFQGCSSLITTPVLPATTLGSYCYENMFQGCSSLTTTPVLPATETKTYCYQYMFQGCSSLTTAPVLPATILTTGCYAYMFQGCSSLTTSPALPETRLAHSCYRNMFSGCSSLTTAPALPATTLVDWCYAYMFSGCSSLTTAPALPATRLATNSYRNMFQICTSLQKTGEIAATGNISTNATNMFANCTSLNDMTWIATTPPTISSNIWTNCPSDMIIYVPAASVDTYQAASVWTIRALYIKPIE